MLGILVVAVVGLLAAAGLQGSIDRVRAQLDGVPGTVMVDGCEWKSGSEEWACSGEFVSEDGTLRILDIELLQWFSERPLEPVPARVSGDSSFYAYPVGGSSYWVDIVGGVVLGLMALGGLILLVVLVRVYPPVRARAAPVAGSPAAWAVSTGPRSADAALARPRAADAGSGRSRAPAVAPPMGPLPRNPVLVVLLSWYLLLAMVAGGLVLALASSDDSDGSVTGTASATVIAAGLGPADQIRMRWFDDTGVEWISLFTPRDPEEFSVGDRVEMRYDPARPEWARPAETSAFELGDRFQDGDRDRNEREIWTVLILTPVVGFLWAWTWRLGRWASAVRRPGQPVTVRVLTATALNVASKSPPGALYLDVRDEEGTVWYQKATWHRRLVPFAMADVALRQRRIQAQSETRFGGPVTGDDHELPERLPAVYAAVEREERPNAVVRRCWGPRPMLVVDIPHVGRIWPSGPARRTTPDHYYLVDQFQPYRVGKWSAGESTWVVLVPFVALVAILWSFAGPVAAASVPVLFGSLWLLLGAGPVRGVYSYTPDESQVRQLRQALARRPVDG
jgi:hypothetical protein